MVLNHLHGKNELMLGYLELTAKPRDALLFELTLSILNPGTDLLTAVWNVQLPPGIQETHGRRTFSGRTVVPPHRKVEANSWLVTVDSAEAYKYEQVNASAKLGAPDRTFTDEFRASVVQIRVE
ncbi:MAG: hypothetical protein WBG54_21155 [Acidobacteriaceae bacterium]